MPQISKPTKEKLVIKGARVHNLKNLNLEIPKNSMVVFTGLSGSGKSSLAFDTIFAEGQRRYVESLSAYARQFLGQVDRPDQLPEVRLPALDQAHLVTVGENPTVRHGSLQPVELGH